MRHIHLDPIGGVAGDMFVAALLDAAPELGPACIEAATAVSGVACEVIRHTDHGLAGLRFAVAHHHHAHAHTAWHAIRARLHDAALPAPARDHALGIFSQLAEAEARVHGIAPEAVTFHEVGAADSIADIVAAAVLIAAQGPATWSTAPLPLGSGTVATAHGLLPVPAPATALLLAGFLTIDDGIAGERVTPTGAAILRHLAAQHPPPVGAQRLLGSGIGCGTRTLPGRANVLRVLISETAEAAGHDHVHRDLAVIGFEVDDQSGEELALGLEQIRSLPGVLDVLQLAGFGKKGRVSVHVQVLAEPAALEAAVAACFSETATIGLRTQITRARALHRHVTDTEVDGRMVRVKRVQRPDGATGKAEADDLPLTGHRARTRLKRQAEGLADD